MEINKLKQFPLFGCCSDEELQWLLEKPYKVLHYHAGDTVLHAGSPCRSLMLVVEGTVETRMGSVETAATDLTRWKELVVEQLVAPCILAPAFLFASDNTIPVEVTAQTEATLYLVNREGFLAFMRQQPRVLQAFLGLISNRVQFLSDKVRAFAIKSLRDRVLDYLAIHGRIDSVAQTAERLGATRPSLSRLLSDLVDEGCVEKDSKGYRATR